MAAQPGLFAGESYLQAVLDAFPAPTLIVDAGLHVLDSNRAADEFLRDDAAATLETFNGHLMHCLTAERAADGCGTTESCSDCILRQTVVAVSQGERRFRTMVKLRVRRDGMTGEVWYIVNGAPFDYEGAPLVIISLEDVTEVAELRRIIPICAHCRKVRDVNEFWQDVEQYLDRHTGVEFSHGICPDCMREHCPEVRLDD